MKLYKSAGHRQVVLRCWPAMSESPDRVLVDFDRITAMRSAPSGCWRVMAIVTVGGSNRRGTRRRRCVRAARPRLACRYHAPFRSGVTKALDARPIVDELLLFKVRVHKKTTDPPRARLTLR